MDAVSLPPEDAEIYIPTINGSEQQQQQPHDGGAASLQLPAICYTPAIAAAAQPLVAARAASGRALVAADSLPGAPILQYRTTVCTQVQFAHTTFHYPPTPPVEAPEAEKLHPGETALAMQQGALDSDPGIEKAAFSSGLPTPPDLETIQCVDDQTSPHDLTMQSSVPASVSDRAKSFVPATSHWAAQPSAAAANLCFMPAPQQQAQAQAPVPSSFSAAAAACGTPNSITCKPVPSASLQPTAVYYQMSEPSTFGVARRIPPLVKDTSCKRHLSRARVPCSCVCVCCILAALRVLRASGCLCSQAVPMLRTCGALRAVRRIAYAYPMEGGVFWRANVSCSPAYAVQYSAAAAGDYSCSPK